MIEVIKRQEGFKSEKSAIESGRPQISYNSDGHICVRLVHDSEKDTLIVFDCEASDRIISFLRNRDLPF